MIRKDLQRVLEIENLCFEFPWSDNDFMVCLRERNHIGLVIEHQDSVVGFIIYELQKHKLNILTIAIHPDYQNYDFGSTLVEYLIQKLSADKRTCITTSVRETNLIAQLFFKKIGFKWIKTIHKPYEDTEEDSYLMQFSFIKFENPRVRVCLEK
jgi:ribosomal-protein-alanine N-acetyltransferase